MAYYGDFESQEHEDYERGLMMQDGRGEPNVVPCFICGQPMYEVSDSPELNVHEDCGPSLLTNNPEEAK